MVELKDYEIVEKLGDGATGAVFRARHKNTQEEAAVKIIHDHLAPDGDTRDRFLEEAFLLSTLEHPNVLRIREYFEDDGHLVISAELLRGQSLKEILAGTERVGLDRGQDWIRQIAKGLAHGHNKGIVHRDVRPANVFITESGLVKLLDFGVNKELEIGVQMNAVGQMAGTPAYLAPETFWLENKVGVKELGVKGDIFAFGMLAYRIFSGRFPYGLTDTVSATDIFTQLAVRYNTKVPIEHIVVLCPEIPRDLADMIMQCLTLDPAVRPERLDGILTVLGATRSSIPAAPVSPSFSTPVSVPAVPTPSQPPAPSAEAAESEPKPADSEEENADNQVTRVSEIPSKPPETASAPPEPSAKVTPAVPMPSQPPDPAPDGEVAEESEPVDGQDEKEDGEASGDTDDQVTQVSQMPSKPPETASAPPEPSAKVTPAVPMPSQPPDPAPDGGVAEKTESDSGKPAVPTPSRPPVAVVRPISIAPVAPVPSRSSRPGAQSWEDRNTPLSYPPAGHDPLADLEEEKTPVVTYDAYQKARAYQQAQAAGTTSPGISGPHGLPAGHVASQPVSGAATSGPANRLSDVSDLAPSRSQTAAIQQLSKRVSSVPAAVRSGVAALSAKGESVLSTMDAKQKRIAVGAAGGLLVLIVLLAVLLGDAPPEEQLAGACEQGDASACMSLGELYLNEVKDSIKAVDAYKAACEKGNAKGCLFLGERYTKGGGGIAKNSGQARFFMRKACAGGETAACEQVGRMLEEDADPAGALTMYEKSCKGGSQRGCYLVGKLLIAGSAAIQKDSPRASTLFEKACAGKVWDACTSLGSMYHTENPRGAKRASDLFEKACAGGDMNGCAKLGVMVDDGRGGEKNPARAIQLFEQACKGNSAEGCFHLASLLEEGKGEARKDDHRAATLYDKACDGGFQDACVALGAMLESGKGGLSKDLVRAAALYEKACARDVQEGCDRAGLAYRYGNGVAKSRGKAETYFQQACDAGYEKSCTNLKRMKWAAEGGGAGGGTGDEGESEEARAASNMSFQELNRLMAQKNAPAAQQPATGTAAAAGAAPAAKPKPKNKKKKSKPNFIKTNPF